MSHSGDGGIQPDGALALGDQETQEHAKRRCTLLDCGLPAGTTLLENKCSQLAGIKAAWLLSKPPEQFANVNAIGGEDPITRAALSMHPLTECNAAAYPGRTVTRAVQQGQSADGRRRLRSSRRSFLFRFPSSFLIVEPSFSEQ